MKAMPEILQVKSPEPSRKINWKNILITVVVLVLLIGGGVGIWILLTGPSPELPSQTPTSTPSTKIDETADWKTAKNDILGFTMKYPPSWGVLMCGNGTTLVNDSEFDPESTKYRAEDSKVLAGTIYCGGGEVTTRILILRGEVFTKGEVSWSKFGTSTHTDFQKEEIVVDNKRGVKYSYTSKQSPGIREGTEYIEYIFEYTNNKSLIVNYFRYPADNLNPQQPDYSDILEKMISTFKFLD